MFQTEHLQEKWQPVLEHPDLPKIEDSYKRAVTTVILENQEKAMREDSMMLSEVSEDLADTEIEKFKSLTQDVEFSDEESFKEKLNTLKESYFPKLLADGDSFNDVEDSTAQDIDTTDSMRKYMSAISRDQKASA